MKRAFLCMISNTDFAYDLVSTSSRESTKDAAARRKNTTDHHRDRHFDPTETVSITPAPAPGLATVGLAAGPSGEKTMADIKTDRQKTCFRRLATRRTDVNHKTHINDIETARNQALDAASTDEVDPVDLTAL